MADCFRCNGSGYLDKKSGKSSTFFSFQGGSAKQCPKCHGSGSYEWDDARSGKNKPPDKNGVITERDYPQYDSYTKHYGEKDHEHKYYEPGSTRSGWTGGNSPRKKRN